MVIKSCLFRGYGGMVDTTDLKSVEALSSCGFKSRFPHHSIIIKKLPKRQFFYFYVFPRSVIKPNFQEMMLPALKAFNQCSFAKVSEIEKKLPMI